MMHRRGQPLDCTELQDQKLPIAHLDALDVDGVQSWLYGGAKMQLDVQEN